MITRPRSTDAFFKAPPQPKRPGPRTQKRKEENRKLGKLNIRHCEVGPLLAAMGILGCWMTSHLTWAHSKKSRFLVTEADWQEAARACIFCHSIIEAWSHSKMKAIILAAIKKRKPNAHSHNT